MTVLELLELPLLDVLLDSRLLEVCGVELCGSSRVILIARVELLLFRVALRVLLVVAAVGT